MGRIQTGVDRLVTLIHDKKKLTIEEASKALGVSKTIISEWADFLEEEGLVELKYSLSKTYLIEKTLNKGDLAQKEKQFATQRETFIQRVDTTIAQLETQTASFEGFKKEFQSIKGSLGSDLEKMQRELTQLNDYHKFKQEVNADLMKQRSLFAQREAETSAAIKRQYMQYEEVMSDIVKQEKKLTERKVKVQDLMSSGESARVKIQEYIKLLEELRGRMTDETKQLGVDDETLEKLRQKARTFHVALEDIHEKELKPLEKLKTDNDEKMKKLEAKILEKAAAMEKAATGEFKEKKVVKKQIEDFLNRKTEIERLLHDIDRDKVDLHEELKELQQRAEAYSLGKTSVRLDELESKLKTIEERKKSLNAHISKFLGLLRK